MSLETYKDKLILAAMHRSLEHCSKALWAMFLALDSLNEDDIKGHLLVASTHLKSAEKQHRIVNGFTGERHDNKT